MPIFDPTLVQYLIQIPHIIFCCPLSAYDKWWFELKKSPHFREKYLVLSYLKLQLTRSKRWALSSIVKVKGFFAVSVNCSIFWQIFYEDEIAGCSSVYLKLDKTIGAHRHCWKYLSAWRCWYHFQDFFFCLVFRINVSYCKNFHLALLKAAAVDVVSDQLVNSRSRVTAARWRLVPANFPKSGRFTKFWKIILSSTRCTFSSMSGAEAQSTLVCCSAVIAMARCDSENVVGSNHASGNSVGSTSSAVLADGWLTYSCILLYKFRGQVCLSQVDVDGRCHRIFRTVVGHGPFDPRSPCRLGWSHTSVRASVLQLIGRFCKPNPVRFSERSASRFWPGRVKVHTNMCEPKVCSANRKLIFGFIFGSATSDGEATGDVQEYFGGNPVALIWFDLDTSWTVWTIFCLKLWCQSLKKIGVSAASNWKYRPGEVPTRNPWCLNGRKLERL